MERLAITPECVFSKKWTYWGDFLGNGKARARTPEEWVPIAEGMAHKNGGKLQCAWWLKKNGFGGLAQAMRGRPELFGHIEQEKPFRSPEEWVPVAEGMAHKNGGKLQCAGWLEKNGFSGLASAMRGRPELFGHIEQEKLCRSPEEWVPIAEGMARKNGGKLQCAGWLRKNGFNGLAQAMRRRPELFGHIEQERRGSHGRLIDDQGEAA